MQARRPMHAQEVEKEKARKKNEKKTKILKKN